MENLSFEELIESDLRGDISDEDREILHEAPEEWRDYLLIKNQNIFRQLRRIKSDYQLSKNNPTRLVSLSAERAEAQELEHLVLDRIRIAKKCIKAAKAELPVLSADSNNAQILRGILKELTAIRTLLEEDGVFDGA